MGGVRGDAGGGHPAGRGAGVLERRREAVVAGGGARETGEVRAGGVGDEGVPGGVRGVALGHAVFRREREEPRAVGADVRLCDGGAGAGGMDESQVDRWLDRAEKSVGFDQWAARGRLFGGMFTWEKGEVW